MSEVDDILEHFGVKGMKWGVRKARNPTERVARIDKKTSRMNADRIIDGAGLVAFYQQKSGGKSKRPYTRARVRLIMRTGAEAAAAIAATNFVLNRVPASPHAVAGAKISFGVLGAKEGLLPRIQEIHNIGVAQKHDRLITERRSLTSGKN